jgi:hypothetical protein
MKTKLTISFTIAFFATALLVCSSLAMLPGAAAKPSTIVLYSTTCTSTSSPTTFGGTWDSGSSTCTVTHASLSSGYTLVIPSGTTLTISNPDGTGFDSGGTVTNHGTITISNRNSASGSLSVGFYNEAGGTVTNYGTITISNGGRLGYASYGFLNHGTVTNYGTITISNGLLTLSIGFDNLGTVTNKGTITISGRGTYGFFNGVDYTVTNYGTITISSLSGTGFYNYGAVTNYGTISNNSGDSFYNYGAVTNKGTITISNAVFIGLYNKAGGTVTNKGTITITNSGGTGFDNAGTVTNKDTISTCGSSGNGFVNESGSTYTGNPVTSC